MKTVYKFSAMLLILTSIIISGCKKVDVGYLSDNIRYGSNPVAVDRGVFKIVTGIIPDNSTPPFKITLLDVRNKETGKREEAFFKESEITVWKEKYDPKTDTTLELINAKRVQEMTLPLKVIEKSGQLMFTQATESVPPGEYLLDLEIENPNGTKKYEGITTIKVNNPVIYEISTAPYFLLIEPGTGNSIRYPHDVDWFDMNKIQSANTQINVTRDAYKTTVTENSVIYDYAQARFPDVYWDSQPNGIFCYYRIYDKWIESVDYVDSWNPPNSLAYKTDPKSYILQLRFDFKFNLPGTYHVDMHLTATKKEGVN